MLAQAIEQRFKDMRHLAQVGESERTTTPLDRMRRTENRIEILAVRPLDIETQQQRLHACQMLGRLFEEDRIKLGHVDGHQ